MLLQENKKTIFAVLLSIYFVELITTAWIGDDAAITIRSVLNFLHGHGLTFNIDERVQAYTHPLWFFAISFLTLIVKNVFNATFILSITMSVFAVWLLLVRYSTNTLAAILVGSVLLLSKAFLDFSTSGLENPLSHVLILMTAITSIKCVERQSLYYLTLYFVLCSLVYLNRPDLLLLIFPLTVWVIAENRHRPKEVGKAMALGAMPVVLWMAFSLYYYGFPLPNTAYAKLGTGIALDERLMQGLRYLFHSIANDPITPVFIAFGIAVGFSGALMQASLAAGITLYMMYVMYIGGDFMGGRFFTAPLLVAAMVISRSKLKPGQLAALGLGVLVLGATSINSTLFSSWHYADTRFRLNGIANERGVYYQQYGLLTAKKETFAMPVWQVGQRRVKTICGGMGYESIMQGPGTHFIDDCALTDPLLSRLPAKYDPDWRIGHFTRKLPTGYYQSVVNNKNLIREPTAATYYDAIRSVTRGELNNWERIKTIWAIHTGAIAEPDLDIYQSKPITERIVLAKHLGNIREGDPWNSPRTFPFADSIIVKLDQETVIQRIDLSVDNNDQYKIEVLVDDEWIEVAKIYPNYKHGMARHQIVLEEKTAKTKQVRITVVQGDGKYALGHFVTG